MDTPTITAPSPLCRGFDCSRPASESDGRCLMHSTSSEKNTEEFVRRLHDQLDEGDLNFQSYVFPSRVDFSWMIFNEAVDFRRATFTQRADFSGAKFNERANFSWARFTKAG